MKRLGQFLQRALAVLALVELRPIAGGRVEWTGDKPLGAFLEMRLIDQPTRVLEAHVIVTLHAGLELLW